MPDHQLPNKMTWTEAYPPLAAYFKQHGHITILPENMQLLISVRTLQKLYKEESLTQQQLSLLKEIQFPFRSSRSTWQQNCIELRHFINQFGLQDLRTLHPTLYSWLIAQRYHATQGNLSNDKKVKLQSIGISFNQEPSATTWNRKYNQLKKELSQLTHPIKYTELSTESYNWLKHQRTASTSPSYDKQKLEKLEQLGIKYQRTSYKQKWETRYHEYCRVNAATSPPKLSKQLSRWCLEQRRQHNNGILLPERIRLLNAVEFNWKTN